MSREYSTHGEKRNAYRISVGKPKGKGPLGKLISTCEKNIKMYLREIDWGVTDWIYLV
jgi:hypothetical protein